MRTVIHLIQSYRDGQLKVVEVPLPANRSGYLLGRISDVLATCLQAGVTRAVFVCNTQVFTHMDEEKRNRLLDAETVITSSGLDYTILRPTMI